MSDSQNMSDEVRARLRAIPSVNELLAEWPVVKAAGETCDAVVHAAVTAELDEERTAIRAGAVPRSKRELASAIEFRAHRSALPSLRPAVNATGVVIHTNLGRAPLAESAAKAVAEVARGYSTLEYSVDTCSRGSRKEHAAQLIRSLTGAEDALVVNNNAAAVLLVLATHAAGKEVIVSRGELVEIGGSFRIPDVMAASGAKLVEVGATNRTHLGDYERAITPETAMILKVHPSNYRIEGFHEEVSSRSSPHWPISTACCSMKTRARAHCCPTTSWCAAAKKPRRLRFRQGLIWCRARAINCSVPHRRALSWAVAIWSRPVGRIRLCAPCARAS